MKIEFIKETKINGDVFWYTTIDDKYVDKSLEVSRSRAYEIFQSIKSSGGQPTIEVIESFETE